MNEQGQHRIPEVYLKQFGFQDKGGKWWISTWRKGDEFTNNKSIKSFTKEIDIFDLPFTNINYKRLFENYTSTIETSYPKIIDEINTKNKLSEVSFSILVQLMFSIFARTNIFLEMIDKILRSEKREYFLSEVTFYFEKEEGESIIRNLKKIDVDFQLNTIMFPVCLYFIRKITSSNFDYVILRDYQNRGWFTSDSPVILFNNINNETLLSKETEIYFPLSKDYCLYIDHKDYNRSNSLRGKDGEELADASEEFHEKITKYIVRSTFQYLIHPTDLGRIKLSPANQEK